MAHEHTAPQARPGPLRDTYTTKSLNNSKASAPFRYNKHILYRDTHFTETIRSGLIFWYGVISVELMKRKNLDRRILLCTSQ